MRRITILLLLIFFVLSLHSWRANICFNPDEHFYYKSSQTLSDSKDIYAPNYYGKHRFQKPPLFYLAVFLSYKLFGVSWFSARLVAILSGILVLIMTYLLGVKMFGREKAFFGTGILATSVLFFRFGRVALPEMTLVLFMSAALYFAYSAFADGKKGLFYLSFAFMAVGTLVKSPVAFLLPAAAIALFSIAKRKEIPPARIPWMPGILIVLGAYLLWFVPAFLIYGRSFLDHMWSAEVVERISDSASAGSFGQYAGHYFQKVFFYVPVMLAQFLPWSALGPAALLVWRKNLETKKYSTQRAFLLFWILAGFLIYTAVPAKRAHYVLSFFPALSLYLVSFFDFQAPKIKRFFNILLSLVIAVYFFAAVIIFPYVFTDGVDALSVRLEKILERAPAPVIVSWRLDPQKIELYIDRPVAIIWEVEFTAPEHYTGKGIQEVVSGLKRGDTSFYIILAGKEHDMYFDVFIAQVEKIAGKSVVCTELYKGWRWRKDIKFKYLPDFDKAFKEEVFLIGVREK